MTHSFVAVATSPGGGIVAARVPLPNRAITRVIVMCAGAWATHLLLDWFSADQSTPRGIQLFWPFDGRWFISGWDIFLGTERRQPFSELTIRRNVEALAQEIAILAPIVVVLWLVRVKTLAGLSSELARGNHSSQ